MPSWASETTSLTPRRPRRVFRSCDRDLPDPASCVQPAAAPDPRLHAVDCKTDGVGPAGAGFLDPFSARHGPGGGAKEPCARQADHSDCGQNRTEGHSEVGWNGHKHGAKALVRPGERLHLALDPDSGDILASELTTEHVGDQTALPSLLKRVDAPVARFLADGAYDGSGVSDCLTAAFGYDVVVPPPKNAVPGGNWQRNQHIEHIAKHGRMA